jgi:hypothetical protein
MKRNRRGTVLGPNSIPRGKTLACFVYKDIAAIFKAGDISIADFIVINYSDSRI